MENRRRNNRLKSIYHALKWAANKSAVDLDIAIQNDKRGLSLRKAKLKSNNKRDTLKFISRLPILFDLISEMPPELESLLLQDYGFSKGQLLQDAVFGNIFKPHKGYFVEVGLGDGTYLSNTWLMEKHKGWNGILFEPNIAFHDSVASSRTAILDKRAAYSKTGLKLDFLDVVDRRELSTIAKFHDSDTRNRSGQHYSVDTVTLNDALAEHSAPRKISFMSIDTEGSELEILAGLNFDHYDIAGLAIEHNHQEDRKAAILEKLMPYGYRQIFSSISDIDIWLVKESPLLVDGV